MAWKTLLDLSAGLHCTYKYWWEISWPPCAPFTKFTKIFPWHYTNCEHMEQQIKPNYGLLLIPYEFYSTVTNITIFKCADKISGQQKVVGHSLLHVYACII